MSEKSFDESSDLHTIWFTLSGDVIDGRNDDWTFECLEVEDVLVSVNNCGKDPPT